MSESGEPYCICTTMPSARPFRLLSLPRIGRCAVYTPQNRYQGRSVFELR
jgi:hypothetical protein